jgi:glutaredoxin
VLRAVDQVEDEPQHHQHRDEEDECRDHGRVLRSPRGEPTHLSRDGQPDVGETPVRRAIAQVGAVARGGEVHDPAEEEPHHGAVEHRRDQAKAHRGGRRDAVRCKGRDREDPGQHRCRAESRRRVPKTACADRHESAADHVGQDVEAVDVHVHDHEDEAPEDLGEARSHASVTYRTARADTIFRMGMKDWFNAIRGAAGPASGTGKVRARDGRELDLELYKKDRCPYCQKVLRVIAQRAIPVRMRDVVEDPAALKKLVEVGGDEQVPCLFVDGKPMYESDDIIAFLEANVGA